MATEKLFYLDSHLREFTARVVSCQAGKHGYDVVLDRTAFYPEGGGQPGDCGTLGGVTVTDTHEAGGEIVHYCESPLEVGAEVTGVLNWQHRFDLMQQHSGEHLVSGFVHAHWGYDNVGFHMGKDAVTIDFNGMISPEDLQMVENEVNQAIWQNTAVEITWPDAETLASLPYRSKKELTGAVRLVRFPEVDLCACCGTHVTHTGEIGLVKFLSCQKFHDGVRIEMLSGRRALAWLSDMAAQNRQISGLLSAKPMETAAAASRMQQELSDTKYRLGQMEDQLFAARAKAYAAQGDVLLFEEAMRPDALRRLTDAITQVCGGRCAVFAKTAEGWQYAMGQVNGDLRALTKEMNTALQGRGGGKPFFVQGSVAAERAAIEAFFA